EEGLAEQIAREARAATTGQGSVLPLVQVICSRLADLAARRPDRVLREADLKKIGGVTGGLQRFVEERINGILTQQADRQAFRQLVARLCLRQPDGTLGTDLLSERVLADQWQGPTSAREVLDRAADDDAGLLRLEVLAPGGQERSLVSLGHDALAPVAATFE